MAEDWAVDVKKYVPDADDTVIAAIVRYCGIALRTRDASLVSFTDPAETNRVRDNFCRKKLGLTDPDPVLDAAIAKVGERMSGDTTRNRVTVYYLLAEAFGKLGLFGAGVVETVEEVIAAPLAAAAPVAAVAAAVAAPAAAAPLLSAAPAKAPEPDDSGWIGTALVTFGVLGAVIIGAAIFGSLLGGPVDHTPKVIPPQTLPIAETAAPVATVAAAVPEGAGVTAQEVAGKPEVSVYFDTAKTDIYPNFDARTEDVRKYVTDHPGSQLQVSGYNDPRGNAALNAELSKNRAFAVRDALVRLGVPEAAIVLVKPADTTDDTDSLARARRVDITVKDAG